VEAFFWSLRGSGLTVDVVEVVCFSDVDDDRAGDRYVGTNGVAHWDGAMSFIGWENHASTF
jgi:hypothetical protein